MAKGYSIRKAANYYRSTKDGKWKLHSSSVWDDNGYTRLWPSIEEAENYAKEIMSKQARHPDEEFYIQYCKIYLGKELIKTVSRQ